MKKSEKKDWIIILTLIGLLVMFIFFTKDIIFPPQTKCPFKRGDTVQLKSGGPLMTIDQANSNSIVCTVQAVWIAEKDYNSAIFNSDLLIKIKEEPVQCTIYHNKKL